MESSISILFLLGVFGLPVWVALTPPHISNLPADVILKPRWLPAVWLQSYVRVQTVLNVGIVTAAGYLFWTGTEPYAPASLSGSPRGQLYTAAFVMYFLYVVAVRQLKLGFSTLSINDLVPAATLSVMTWVSFLVLGLAVGELWSGTWPAERAVALGLWLALRLTSIPYEWIIWSQNTRWGLSDGSRPTRDTIPPKAESRFRF